jgi:hypothetical protein
MTNPLTGDHDVVMQVSVGTLNRLLASMHQNGLASPSSLPTLPHSAFVRLGDDPATRVDGVHGVVRLQAGVPQLDLIHRSQDRFRIRIDLRSWFTRSSGSAPFPEFTYGTLRAEFGLKELPQFGEPGAPLAVFPGAGPTYLPPRYHFDVDPSTVSFTSFGDTSQDAAIARQAVALLKTVFATAGGQPMLEQLKERKLISLVGPDGSQVVAIGVERGPGTPGIQQPANITRVLTAGQDFAVAASREFALSLLEPHLKALEQSHPVVHIEVSVLGFSVVSADYVVDFAPAASWALDTATVGGVTLPCGAIDLTVAGRATTSSALPNCSFTIRDRLLVIFNPSTQVLVLDRKGTPNVQVDVAGPAGGAAEGPVRDKITDKYKTRMDEALQAARPQMVLATLTSNVVTQQLKLSDPQASIKLVSAEFSQDGAVVRGSISLSPRQRGVVSFGALNDLTGYGAFLSWFPGGRIVAFSWKWEPPPPAPDGTTLDRAVVDRFVFQPPEGMPGLPPPDGGATVGGRVCVSIHGLVIDPVTGLERPALVTDCYSVPDPLVIIPIFPIPGLGVTAATDRVTTPLWMRVGRDRETAIVDAARATEDMSMANTLLVSAGSGVSSLDEVIEGIDGADRDDAGLLVLVLVPEGGLSSDAASAARAKAPQREAPIRVIEDIGGSWSRAFGLSFDAGEALRLIGADSRVLWSHDGPIEAATLSGVLREHLQASGTPGLVPQRPGPAVGRRPPGLPVQADAGGDQDGPVERGLVDQSVTVCFALGWAASSRAQVYRLNERSATGGELVVVVLTDATSGEAAAFAEEHAPRVIVVPDPDRTITAQHDVWLWPTTITLGPDGTVVSSTAGSHPDDDVPPPLPPPMPPPTA